MVPQKVASQKAGGCEVSGIVLYQESMNGVAESGINRNKAASLLVQARMDVLARHGCCGIRNAVGKREGNGRPGVKHHIMGLAGDYRFQNKPLLLGWTAPTRHRDVPERGCRNSRAKEPSMEDVIRIGIDTSKHVFQLHGVNAAEQPVLRKKMRRREMIDFLAAHPPVPISIEAGGASHHWARFLGSLGHDVKLIPPQLSRPYVKRGKTDAADAEALCEAMSRPTMRYVPVKTADQQAALMLIGIRERLIGKRTQLSNTIRGYAAEFGLTAARGLNRLAPLLERIQKQ